MSGRPVGIPRHEFTARTKRAAWERADGHCEGLVIRDTGNRGRCGAPLKGRFYYDHIDPDWFSKNNELENCQVLCAVCNKAKTASDVKSIAKSKRIIDKRIGIKKKSSFRGWRKFDGTVVFNR